MKTRITQLVVFLLLLTLALSACATEEPTSTPVPPTSTPVPPTSTPVPPTATHTPVPPTDTPTPVPPTATPTPVPPTPTPASAPALALTDEYVDEETGIGVQLPEGWVATSFFGITLISESQEALDATMGSEMPEMIVLLFSSSFDEMSVDPADIDSPADLFEMEGISPLGGEGSISESWETDDIVELEIDGYPAAATGFTSDLGTEDEMNGYSVVVLLEDVERIAVFAGGTTPDRWEEMEPTIKAIAHSMTFFEPQVAEPPAGSLNLSDEPFVNATKGYSISYPDGWQSMDMDEMVLFIQDLSALSGDIPTAVIVMADAIETFLDGALVGITPEQLEAVMVIASSQMGEDLELGKVESFTVDGQPASGGELIGTTEETASTSGYMTLVLGDTQAAIIMAVMPSEQWEAFKPTFFAMQDTFSFTGEVAGPTGPAAGGEAGESRANPVALGEVGQTAQWNFQILEVLRGDEAWDMLLAASEWNDPPDAGFEYVLVKIAAEHTGGNKAEKISYSDFDVTGSDAILYEIPWMTNPDPELDAELMPGGVAEGWASFTVQEGEENLILVYDVWGWDEGPLYFALEEGASISKPTDLAPEGDAQTGASRSEPAQFGVKIFETPWEIQVMEVLRGDEAWDALLAASEWNDPPAEGMEYILLRIYARNLSKTEKAQEVDGNMFHVTADNNILYRYAYLTEPEPELDAYLYPGGEWTGWLTYEIGVGEENPVLVMGNAYDLDEGGRFLALEEGAGVAFPGSIDVTGDQNAGAAVDDPAPAGTVIATRQWEFTVLEVVRGDAAWDALYKANEYNDEPEMGMEYVLLRLKVRNISDEDAPYNCDNDLFKIVGDNKTIYDSPYLTVPEPELDAWLYPNGETEGWIALQVAEDESGLILILSDSYFASTQRYLLLEE